MPALGPRLVVAATRSGSGKTTIAAGLLAAFRRRGVRARAAKVGPDFIDPTYHAAASGHPCRNLDPWISGLDSMGPLAGRAADGGQLLVVEGVMGLFDGAADGSPSSTADVAVALDAPVLLVVDTTATGRSVAALVHGFHTFDPRVRIGGVILNRIASPTHHQMLADALTSSGVPILGAIPRLDALHLHARHLGLVPVVENRAEIDASLNHIADVVDRHCDLQAIRQLAVSAPAKQVGDPPRGRPSGTARIALASGAAFSFTYPDNIEALEWAGATIIPFDPCRDESLPEHCDGVVVGGGFPEVYAEQLAANRPLLDDVRRAVQGGSVVWAECGGLLWLAERLADHQMAAVLPTVAEMTSRLTLGYRQATTRTSSPLGPPGTRLRGHEFHYSFTTPQGDALDTTGATGTTQSGFATTQLFASYLHQHLGADPSPAEQFVRAADRARTRRAK
jgi:cobyrinic acid a,c-diamide synthase